MIPNKSVDKPRVLFIEDGEDGYYTVLELFQRSNNSSPTKTFDLEFLAITTPRIQMEDDISKHLMKNDYDLVLTPIMRDTVESIRSQYLGILVGYGTIASELLIQGGKSYDSLMSMMYFGNFNKEFTDDINIELGLVSKQKTTAQ